MTWTNTAITGSIVRRTPRRISKDQRALLEQLASTMRDHKAEPRTQDATESDRPFFERVKDIFG